MDRKISQDYSSLVGKSYEKMNCWQAAQEFYKLCMGVELKQYFGDVPNHRAETKNLIYSNRGEFTELLPGAPMQFGDILIFKVRGIESHLGMYVSPGKFFHSTAPVGSCTERLDKWKHLIAGVYRLNGEAA